MSCEQIEINNLQRIVDLLEKENRLLKERLQQAGISYDDICGVDNNESSDLYDPDQGARIRPFVITDKTAEQFFEYFCRGRKDVYSLRYSNPKTGKTGYYPQCFNRWDSHCHIQKKDKIPCRECEIQSYKPLSYQLIKEHMEGKDSYGNDVLAIYPMLEGNLCQLLVFDFDNHTEGAVQNDYANTDDAWRREVDSLREICRNLGIECAVERSRSGSGAHLWIFFKDKVPAKLARRFGFALLEKGAETVDLKSFRYYDRMIPTQDVLPKGGLGNVIALPLQGLALKNGNSAFVDEKWNAYEEQLKFLANIRRLTKRDIEEFLAKWQGSLSLDLKANEDCEEEPWNKSIGFSSEDVSGAVKMVISDRIYVDTSNMSNRMRRALRRMAAFSNKKYFQNLAMDKPNYAESRYIYLGTDEGKYLILPRGLLDELCNRLERTGIEYSISDKRSGGTGIHVKFIGNLRDSQRLASEEMLAHDTGILQAATAFGKTVVSCEMIAEHGVNTLILVDKSDLMNQWMQRLKEFLVIDEDLPQYRTPSGQIRTRKSLIGNLQGSHDTLTGIIDVAMIRSIKKKDEFHPMLGKYGQVIMDECHHGASDSAIEVLQAIKARYVYGVTATPKRGDGKERINEYLLGPIRHRFTAKDRAIEQNIDHLVYPRFTKTVAPHRLSKSPYGNEAFELIRDNDVRDDQIANDVIECVRAGRTPVVLSKYVDHAEKLAARLENQADNVILLTGKNGTKVRRTQVEILNKVSPSESLILVGTGSLLGEGFDYPRLDTLFMATPVSGEQVVEQYVGRLNRDYEGKENVIVYDYVDSHVPKFDKMYISRLKAYKKIGYELCAGLIAEKQQANAIFDIDNYAVTFWRDLEAAGSSVIISSPRLNREKVERVIDTMRSRQESGVKVTVVTWHPDFYVFGKSEARMALMERMRKAGFEIRLVEETCEHFAIIDDEVVWYGSMDLLAKEDAEDNLMRVCSRKIAAELLELTFGGKAVLLAW